MTTSSFRVNDITVMAPDVGSTGVR